MEFKGSIMLVLVVSVLLSSSAVLICGNGTDDDVLILSAEPAIVGDLAAVETWDIGMDRWVRGSTDGFVVTVNLDTIEFVKAELDGDLLTKDVHYSLTPGSTIFTLLPSYLETLETGEYELYIEFTGGDKAWIPMTIAEPDPGFEFNTMILIVLVVMILVGSGVIYLFKRQG